MLATFLQLEKNSQVMEMCLKKAHVFSELLLDTRKFIAFIKVENYSRIYRLKTEKIMVFKRIENFSDSKSVSL